MDKQWHELTVLVPAGAEYSAVKKGLRHTAGALPEIIAVPAGQAITPFVKSLVRGNRLTENVLMMGLGGGLCGDGDIGQGVLLKQVWHAVGEPTVLSCNHGLTQQIAARLSEASVATGVMCDRVVTTAVEKRVLGDRYHAQVVDMESFSLLQALPNHSVAILRVISDRAEQDLPDITQAIRPDGSLDAVNMAVSFAKRPVAALRLITASLQALRQLTKVAECLFQ